MKLPADMTPAERALVRAFEALDSDYQKLKRENAALRNEIFELREALIPPVDPDEQEYASREELVENFERES